MLKIKLLLCVFPLLLLVGCASEVDKCVDARMAGWAAQQERIKEKIRKLQESLKKVGDGNWVLEKESELDGRTRAEVEAAFRVGCLKISSGK